MEAVVEFHGFKDNENRFVIKELAVVSDLFQWQLVFAPPYSKCRLNSKMQRTARWLTRHFHRIDWDDGVIPYNEHLIRTLCKTFPVIYTKGLEKATFLKQFHPDVREIDCTTSCNDNGCDIGCVLPQHSDVNSKCALRNALLYKSSLDLKNSVSTS